MIMKNLPLQKVERFFVAGKESEADLMMTEDETEIEIPSLWTQSCTEENTKINYTIKN